MMYPVRRRRWLWVMAGFCLLVFSMPLIASLQPKTYAFLSRFHPQEFEANWGGQPYGRLRGEKVTVLLFEEGDSDAVLESMRSALMPARGFTSESSQAADGTTWSFFRSRWLSPATAEEGFDYFTGDRAQLALEFARTGRLEFVKDEGRHRCLVLAYRPKTWSERAIDSVKSWLHL